MAPFLWFPVSLVPGGRSYYRSAAISEVEAVGKTFSTPARQQPFRTGLIGWLYPTLRVETP